MRLADLPRTVISDGRRPRYEPRYYAAPLLSEAEAWRQIVAQAQDVHRQSLGCIRMMLAEPQRATEIGRVFLASAGASTFARPVCARPVNLRGTDRRYGRD